MTLTRIARNKKTMLYEKVEVSSLLPFMKTGGKFGLKKHSSN